MLKIRVEHKIGEIVEHSFNESKYKVIWYNYVDNRWPQYICLQSGKEDYVYMNSCELKKNKDREIGFITKK